MAEITKIDKLNGKNYQSWKYNVKLVLMERGLWGFTQEGKEIPPGEGATNAAKNAFQLRSDKAYSLIALNVEKHLQIHISNTTDPLTAWKNLQKQFEFVSVTQVVRLNRKFYAATMEEGGDLMKHLTHMTSLAEQLREMEEDISPKKFATVVLGSLPESYDNFLTSLNARKAEEMEWDSIKGLLIEEYMKRKEKFDNNKNDNALFTNRKSNMSRGRNYNRRRYGEHSRNWTPADYKPSTSGAQQQNDDRRGKSIICYKCNKAGHIAKNCPLNNRQGGNKGEHSKIAEGGGVALISSTGKSNEWYVDSAATKHMTNSKDIFVNYTEYRAPVNIYLGDNTCIKALGEGMVNLYTQNDNSFHLELHKVLYVPMLAKNLLSVPAMVSMGAKVLFDDKKCVVSKDGKEYVIGKLVDGMLFTVSSVEFAHPTTEPMDVWHQRFGHLNGGYVNQLKKNDMVTGMMCDESKQVEKDCKGCLKGKMHRNSFPKASLHRATKPYEIIHSDVCGPMQVESIGGSRYMVTFTDDYSRYTVAYFIKKKDEVITKFMEFVNYVESQSRTRGTVKILRSDNGGEYKSNSFSKFCAEKGIVQQFTCPYSPEQNGVAERLNRTLLESARSMIYQANLPLVFWAEACNTAVYLHNRSPTVALKDKTPYECLYSEKPDVSNLKVFGCTCYVHIPDSNRRKLDQKSYEAIFVGYPTGTKGYKVYDVKSRKFAISRNVQFLEKKFHNFEETKDIEHQIPNEEKQTEGLFDLQVQRVDVEPEQSLHEYQEEFHVDPIVEADMNLNENIEQSINQENEEPVGESEVPTTSKTYEEKFMEDVRNLGPIRQRKIPNKFKDNACPVVESLTSEVDDPESVQEALNGKYAKEWKDAMSSEYSSLLENDTWELVPPCEGQSVVGSRWVLKVKRKEDGSIDRFKARVVAQGYSQTKGTDYDEVFSPVARHTSLRTLLALANAHDLEVHQMDVRTAFLNGDIDCDIYMAQPEGFVDPDKPDYLCKLKKSIYGLKQSARCWNDTLDGYLKSRGYRKSGADGCIYVKSVKKDDGRISFVILGVYVDDIIPVSNDIEMLDSEKKALSKRFKMDDKGEVHFLLGMLIKRDRENKVTTISQRNYVERILSKFGMESCKPVSTPLEPGTKFSSYPMRMKNLTHKSTSKQLDV